MLPLLVWHLHGGKGRRERKRGFSAGYRSSKDHIFSSRKEKKEGQVNIRMEVRTKEKRKRESVTAGVQCSYQTVYVCWRVTRHMACSCPTSSTQKFFFAPLVFLLFCKVFYSHEGEKGSEGWIPIAQFITNAALRRSTYPFHRLSCGCHASQRFCSWRFVGSQYTTP